MKASQPPPETHATSPGLLRRHTLFGWWSLFLFALFGLLLEALHAFKAGFYLDVDNDARRLMWRLSHAHGGLLALIHLAFANTLKHHAAAAWRLRLASSALVAASLLLPGGFLLAGAFAEGSDPGLAAGLIPVGGGLLLFALGRTAWVLSKRSARPPGVGPG